MADTKIEWTDKTWNPLAGCNDKSEGCRNCYARGMARRLEAMGQEKYKGLTVLQGSHVVWTGKISFDEKVLLQPLEWKKPCRIFVNSMSDLFHENVSDEWIDKIFAVMALCPQHHFQVLTKRPERMRKYMGRLSAIAVHRVSIAASLHLPIGLEGKMEPIKWPLPNVWMGVSVENQAEADERIPLLLDTPAAVRFISAEPLLGSVNLNRIEVTEGEVDRSDPENPIVSGYCIDAMSGEAFDDEYGSLSTAPDGEVPLERGLDWVIVGGESGPGARPMEFEWAQSIVDQCRAAGVACFVKQMGSGLAKRYGWKSAKGGDWHGWPTGLMVREFPRSR